MNKKKSENDMKFEKKEIIYSAIIEKELLHNGLVQREQLKTLKEVNETMKGLTSVLKEFERHEFLTIHKSKWKIALYNFSLWILFAIWTVFWLFLVSWFTYHFIKDSEILKNIVDNQLKIRQFNIQDIRSKITSEKK
ncbi:MAG: hypothetical protein ACD_4C00086G0003 [uncultured bacterium (gcode 4)]|uniref:Uncharacterized protein n=1 Tax=uncultured bacterium (gcode 4) TaxID=1234023 RepID=K2FYN3_9BACT|nr:MAG: hypothetical protein ACD_4C00086G0003 [uncultured bacterium (gcode 4)]